MAVVALAALAPASTSLGAESPTAIERTYHFVFEYPEHARPKVAHIVAFADEELERIGAALGARRLVSDGPSIRVVVTPNRAAFDAAQLSPDGAEPWMAGTAYPARDLIILSLEPSHFFRLEEIARHEISHIALYRAAERRHLPRWLDEGLAILNAGEDTAERLKTAAGAALTGSALPFAGLERSFPDADGLARLAYAQSATFVRWLMQRHELDAKLAGILAAVRSGTLPMVAIESALGLPLTRLERMWQEELSASWTWLAVLTDAGAIWSVAAVVFAVALLIAYSRHRKRLRNRLPAEDDEAWPPTPLALMPQSPPDDDWPANGT